MAGPPLLNSAMPFRRRLLPAILLSLCALVAACSITSKAQRHAADVAEANRLYRRANDFVSRVTEGDFSYSYMQFYWKRAESYIQRVERDYPDTPVGQELKEEKLKVGPFSLTYFRDRVLPWLEVKRLGSFDPVNCAIFLYNLNEDRWDPVRLAAFSSIIEVLSRQQRWSEALIFPILPQYHYLLLTSMFRIAARFNQTKIIAELMADSTPAEKQELYPILGEAMAVRGVPRTTIVKFLNEHPTDAVRLAVLTGMCDRELQIRRAAALRIPLSDVLLQGGRIEDPKVRDDVEAVAREFFPNGNHEASLQLAAYRAGLGELDAARHIAATAGLTDLTAIHLAYLGYLAAFERYDEMSTYVSQANLTPEQARRCRLDIIELLARHGQISASENALHAYLKTYAEGNSALADEAELAWFRGRIRATGTHQLTVRADTFSNLPIKDPCIMAQAIMDWSLAPNRTLRGASPWDSVVYKYRPGFINLPAPKARDVARAAAELPPY